MDENTRETIGYYYYDANAASYVADTAGVEFGALQQEFAQRLPEAAASSTWAAGRAATPSRS